MDTNLQTYTVLVEIVHMTINRVAPSSTVWPCVPVLWSPDIPVVLDRIRWPEERQRSNIHSYFFYLIQYHKGFISVLLVIIPSPRTTAAGNWTFPCLLSCPPNTLLAKCNYLLYFRRKMSVTVLHQEELLKIFSMLSYRDVISVGRTCRRFHVLSQDDLLLKNIARRELSADRWKINHVYPTREQISVVTSLGTMSLK